MVVADWGSANDERPANAGNFLGGTPVYAGPKTFEAAQLRPLKDLFSFGRIALELMMDKSGTD